MNVEVHTSTVADGSMYNRHDLMDVDVVGNRRNFLATLHLKLEDTMRVRVHYDTDNFCRYHQVDDRHRGQGMINDLVIPADALITRTPGLALFLPVADCIAATLYDETNKVLALAHFGRHSLEQQGGTKLVQHLAETYGTNPAQLQVWLSPAAGKDAYPIWKLDNQGMKEAMHAQLAAAGIDARFITDNTAETTSDETYYSYSEFLKGNRDEDGDFAMVAVMR